MTPNDFNTDPPDPPHHLSADAKCKWRETWPRLDHRRFEFDRDQDVLAQYCAAWADICQAEHGIENPAKVSRPETTEPEGPTNTGHFYEQRLVAMDRFDQLGEQLGLSLYTHWSFYASSLKSLPPELAERDGKQKSVAPTRRRIWTLERVWTALQRACGKIADAARLLSMTYGVNCDPSTILRLVRDYPQLGEAIEDSKRTLYDACYDTLVRSAVAGDQASRHFVLRKRHPGYKAQPEHSDHRQAK